MKNRKSKNFKEVQTFLLLDDQLYKKLGDGILAKCISGDLEMKILTRVHFEVCGVEGPTLARRIQRMRYFEPELRKEATEIQKNCEKCQMVLDVRKNYFVEKED